MSDPSNQPNHRPRVGLIPDPEASETEKILGVAAQHADPIRAGIDPQWHSLYDRLVNKRDELIDTIHEATEQAREVQPDPIEHEPADVATPTYHRDEILGSATFEQELLEEVNEAISRLQSGSYGICQLTGRAIPRERLEAIPWTRFTLQAEQELEARGEVTKAAIGPLGNVNERGTATPGRKRKHEGSQ